MPHVIAQMSSYTSAVGLDCQSECFLECHPSTTAKQGRDSCLRQINMLTAFFIAQSPSFLSFYSCHMWPAKRHCKHVKLRTAQQYTRRAGSRMISDKQERRASTSSDGDSRMRANADNSDHLLRVRAGAQYTDYPANKPLTTYWLAAMDSDRAKGCGVA